jgi:transposase-like protein
MARKQKKNFSDDEKRRAVDEYVSGRKSAEQVADEMGVPRGYVYKWRVQLGEKAKGARVDELEAQGMSPTEARRIQAMEDELAVYKAKVAEQTVIIDLLKKLQTSTVSQPESELTGLIATTRRLARSRKPAK